MDTSSRLDQCKCGLKNDSEDTLLGGGEIQIQILIQCWNKKWNFLKQARSEVSWNHPNVVLKSFLFIK